MTAALSIADVRFRYGEHEALRGVSLQVARGEIFGLLGPNGGGKTTLFRLLSTLIPPQQGSLRLLDADLATEADAVRRRLGVVFQSPSLDKKLTVQENLIIHGQLYGLAGGRLRQRSEEMLARLGLLERRRDLVETLSGGMRRRVELAKGLLHRPELLLLDEPSTGLDPGARIDLWAYLRKIRQDDGVTIVLTTHLLEEADQCDRIGIMSAGELVALGTPAELRATVGGDSIILSSRDPERLARDVRVRFGDPVRLIDGRVRLQRPAGHDLAAQLMSAFSDQIESLTLAKPSLEDVFIARTGHRFWQEHQDE